MQLSATAAADGENQHGRCCTQLRRGRGRGLTLKMGQSQHKYAAVHLYSEGLEGCIDKVPSVAYLLPGSYCDNTDEFGVDQTKVVGGLFYDSKSEWWKDPPVSDFGWGKLPYQGTYLDDSSANDVCGALSFQCPEIALYSNQSICNYTTMCPPPSTSACADRTLGNSLNVAASSTAMLDAVQYYRIECEFDVRGSLLFRELDGDSCSDFDETFADTTGVPGVSDGQNYVGWWALPGVFGSSLGQANCVDASHEGTYWQRWVLSEQTQSSSEGDKVVQTVDVKFFLEEAECNAFDDQVRPPSWIGCDLDSHRQGALPHPPTRGTDFIYPTHESFFLCCADIVWNYSWMQSRETRTLRVASFRR